jgi:protein-arginine kinase activator protein McsA
MDEAGRVFSETETAQMQEAGSQPEKVGKQEQKKLTPLEMLQQQLDKAVEEERYEDAAKLRDEIKRYEGSSTHN